MPEPPPEAMLRLREADVVRLCGLAAAARGLALVDRHAVMRARREGARLSGIVHDSGPAAAVTWVEIAPTAGAIEAGAWECAHPGDGSAGAPGDGRPALACAHVAALLTAWIRRPGDFAASAVAEAGQRPGAAGTGRNSDRVGRSAAPGGIPSPTPGEHIGGGTQPPVSAEVEAGRPTLVEELRRLADGDRLALARRILGPEPGSAAGAGAKADDQANDYSNDTDPRVMTARLASALADPAFVGRLLERLDGRAVDLLRGFNFLGNALTEADVRGIAERSDLGWSAVETALEVLARHGLAFRARGGISEAGGSRASAGWVIPPEVAAAVGSALPLRALAVAGERGPPWLPRNEGQPERVARVQPAMARQLCAAAGLLARAPGPVGLADAGGIGAASGDRRGAWERERARRVGRARSRPVPPMPGEPSDAELAAWARAAQLPPALVRMVRRLLPRARAASGFAPALGDLGRLPPVEWPLALRAAFQVWLEVDDRDELLDLGDEGSDVQVRYDPTHPGLRPVTLAAENTAARRRLVAAVARLPAEKWVAVEDLLDLLWWLDPHFLRGRQRAFEQPAWWFEEVDTGRRLRADERAEWRRAEGRYVTALLTGPLRWWGAVELAIDPREAVVTGAFACRLTAQGAYVLGLTDEAPAHAESLGLGWGPAALPARGGTLALQPLATGAGALDALAPWTEVSGVAGGRLMVRPADDRAARELDLGHSPDAALACLRALDAHDGTHAAGVFESVARAWRERYGEARIESGLVPLEAADEAALREALATAPSVAARCRVVTPTLALVPAGDVEPLRHALNRRGFVV